jgi:5-methylcytosine-specific restriction endonuclease McrA
MRDELGTYIDLPQRRPNAAGTWLWVLRSDPCAYCGRYPNLLEEKETRKSTIDHIQPLADGGERGFSLNGTGSCYQCNHEKSGRNLLGFLMMTKRRKDRKKFIEQNRLRTGIPQSQLDKLKKVFGE